MQPDFSLALYRSEPNKSASTCADAFLATTPIHYLSVCIPPRSLSETARDLNRSKSLNQILPEKSPNVYKDPRAPTSQNPSKPPDCQGYGSSVPQGCGGAAGAQAVQHSNAALRAAISKMRLIRTVEPADDTAPAK